MIARTFLILVTTIAISGCSTLGSFFNREIEVVTKPVQIEIIQPTLPREISLENPRWYVVSEAVIANPCNRIEGQEGRPQTCNLEDRENPSWPEGYTYLDRFLDDMKSANGGDIVFVATTVKDYEMMSTNVQELRRYIRELGEVIVYYRNVTMPNGEEAIGVKIERN